MCRNCKNVSNRYIEGVCIRCYKKKYYQLHREAISKKRKEKYISQAKPQRYCEVCNQPVGCNAREALCRIHQYEKYYKWTIEQRKKSNKDRARKNRAWKIGHDPKTIYKKFNYRCKTCGSTKNLQIHHKDGKGSNVLINKRNNNIGNLELLCIKCHGKLHGKQSKKTR